MGEGCSDGEPPVKRVFGGIASGVMIAAIACSGGAKSKAPQSTPEPTASVVSQGARTVVEKKAVELLTALATQDADGYRAVWYPDQRPSAMNAHEALTLTLHDVIGCDIDAASITTDEKLSAVTVKVMFPTTCGSGGITDTCTVDVWRRESAWWVQSWVCT